MQNAQEIKMTAAPSCLYNAAAIFAATLLASMAMAVGIGIDPVAGSQAPTTKVLVAEYRHFESFAAGRAMPCGPEPADSVVEISAPDVAPTAPGSKV